MQEAWTLVQARVNGKRNHTQVPFQQITMIVAMEGGTTEVAPPSGNDKPARIDHVGTSNSTSAIPNENKRRTASVPERGRLRGSWIPNHLQRSLTSMVQTSLLGRRCITFLLNWHSLPSVQMRLKRAKQDPSRPWKRKTKICFSKYHGQQQRTPRPNHKLSRMATSHREGDTRGQRVFQAGLSTGTTLSMPSDAGARQGKDEKETLGFTDSSLSTRGRR